MFFLFLLLSVSNADARWVKFETFRFQPVDEAERDSSFYQFRYKLLRALETRDTAALLPLLAEDVTSHFGKPGSVEGFRKTWKLEGERQRESEIWDKLRDTARLGGSFVGGEFHAPYVYSRWPQRFPHLDFYAVLEKKTPLHKKPDPESRVLATLSQEVVGRFDELPNGPGWRAVRTSEGITGYMQEKLTRSPLDYRAIFKKVGGEWKLALFAVGDWEAHERLD